MVHAEQKYPEAARTSGEMLCAEEKQRAFDKGLMRYPEVGEPGPEEV